MTLPEQKRMALKLMETFARMLLRTRRLGGYGGIPCKIRTEAAARLRHYPFDSEIDEMCDDWQAAERARRADPVDYPAQIIRIMDDFDFNAVAAHMLDTRWVWADPDEGSCVPTRAKIRRVAHGLLCEVASDDKRGHRAESGGFRASNHDGTLRLAFEVEAASGAEGE